MSTESSKIYGADWGPDCHRSKNYLEQQKVPFQWINVDQNDEAQAYVREMNDNKLDCMNTAEFRPVAYAPTAIPMASSSRVADTRWKKGSSLMRLVTLSIEMSGT